jgi:hypothetical protein
VSWVDARMHEEISRYIELPPCSQLGEQVSGDWSNRAVVKRTAGMGVAEVLLGVWFWSGST